MIKWDNTELHEVEYTYFLSCLVTIPKKPLASISSLELVQYLLPCDVDYGLVIDGKGRIADDTQQPSINLLCSENQNVTEHKSK